MSRQELYFTVFGRPVPQGSKNVFRGRLVEASKDLKPWRAAIAEAVFNTWKLTGDERQFTDPVVVKATFILPKPKTVKRLLPTVPPDLDKLQRALGDAISIDCQALQDDSFIVGWRTNKIYASDPQDAGVRVSIRAVDLSETDGSPASLERLLDKAFEKPSFGPKITFR
ncbi:Rus Holliday junction resolvase [uncultured Caudovirales phage]|uniref:Rus Holliday junction resolvase n=1 Tax=uncultured Caudovirales phage TaxID=2100421 RepID=A0A6J5NBC5_9CAUD|nr:Rus Holliday junction resolvase [uncultured Caudovirales phage]